MAIKWKQAASTRQVSRQKKTVEVRIRRATRIHRSSALSWVSHRRVRVGTSIRIEANRVQRRIHDAKAIFLSKESLLIGGPRLQVVDTFDVGNIGTHSGVRKPPVLGQCLLLKTRGEIGKWIAAGIIIELVMPHERAYG